MTQENRAALFLDTASKNLSLLALCGRRYSRVDLGDPKKALERTHLGIDMVLSALHLSLREVSAFYCLLGPGSNTGIRLGLTIAKTVKGIRPDVSLYGIGTLELMLLVDERGLAVLSDRNGDLYLASRKEGKVEERKIRQEDVPSLHGTFLVEGFDHPARTILRGKDVRLVDILTLMVERKADFRDYSETPKEYRPRYAFEI